MIVLSLKKPFWESRLWLNCYYCYLNGISVYICHCYISFLYFVFELTMFLAPIYQLFRHQLPAECEVTFHPNIVKEKIRNYIMY